MRKGRIEKAESITNRISQSIVDRAKVTLSSCGRGSKELWEKVRQITGKNKSDRSPNQVTVEELNEHFATTGISRDPQYTPPLPKASVNVSPPCSVFTEYQVFHMLDHIKHTSAGLDNLPHWFLQLAAPFLSLPVSHLFNMSLKTSVVPTQ